MRKLQSLAIIVLLMLIALPQSAIAKEPDQVGFIQFYNRGSYTIDNVWIKWKDGKETKQHRFTQNIAGGAGLGSACYDLSLIKASDGSTIPDGAEVWLSAEIQTGETKSCRKDTKKYYKAGSSDVLKYRMGGQTYTNNRCKLGYKEARLEIEQGNSKKCDS